MKAFLTRAFALNFAAAIHEHLDSSAVIGTGTPFLSAWTALKSRSIWYRVEGTMILRSHRETGESSAPVKILIAAEWLKLPPIAFCRAGFIRHEIDWHILSDGSLCHVLAQQWIWQLEQWWQDGHDMDFVVDAAATWCCQNIDSLITRHLHGYRAGLSKWPKQWGQWSHCQRGVDEFERSLNTIVAAA